MLMWLTRTDDENYRGIGAAVLGKLKHTPSVPALQAALKREPVPWVRQALQETLEILEKAEKNQLRHSSRSSNTDHSPVRHSIDL